MCAFTRVAFRQRSRPGCALFPSFQPDGVGSHGKNRASGGACQGSSSPPKAMSRQVESPGRGPAARRRIRHPRHGVVTPDQATNLASD